MKVFLIMSSVFFAPKKAATSEEVRLGDFEHSLLQKIKGQSLDIKLRNMVYYWLKERCSGFKTFACEPLDYMKKFQVRAGNLEKNRNLTLKCLSRNHTPNWGLTFFFLGGQIIDQLKPLVVLRI